MTTSEDRTLLFDTTQVNTFVEQIADSICKEFFNGKTTDLALLGIQLGGIPLARRIAKIIEQRTGTLPEVGSLDITMYRDDFGMRKRLPQIHETFIPFDLNKKVIILTDDVLQTGRSIRAALDAITDYGRPSMIRLATLIDRGLREFPIRADYVGSLISVPREMRVSISWSEYTGTDAVYSQNRANSSGAATK